MTNSSPQNLQVPAFTWLPPRHMILIRVSLELCLQPRGPLGPQNQHFWPPLFRSIRLSFRNNPMLRINGLEQTQIRKTVFFYKFLWNSQITFLLFPRNSRWPVGHPSPARCNILQQSLDLPLSIGRKLLYSHAEFAAQLLFEVLGALRSMAKHGEAPEWWGSNFFQKKRAETPATKKDKQGLFKFCILTVWWLEVWRFHTLWHP